MMRLRREFLLVLLKFSDLCVFTVGIVLADWFAKGHGAGISLGNLLSLQIKVANIVWFAGMILAWHIMCQSFHLYRSRRLQHFIQEWKDIVRVTTAGAAILFLGGKIFGVSIVTLPFSLVFWLSTTLLTITLRTFLRYFLRKVRALGRNLRFVLIVGTNERARGLARMIEDNRELGYVVIGYVDDLLYNSKEGLRILGTPEDFRSIIRNRVVDEVFICLPIKSKYEKIQRIIEVAEEQGIVVRHMMDIFNTKNGRTGMEALEGFGSLEVIAGSQDDWRLLPKRLIDVVVGSVVLIITLPVMFVAALMIKLTSRGHVLFVQDRIGYNKRTFRLYKFRTMVMGAEKLQQELEARNEMDGPVFKIRNDPRVTTVGRWLRNLSIDELPQLFNVIKGDMSMVGPRPLPVRDYNGFDQDWQRRRFSVRPGITCTWQINGRSNTSFEDWIKWDMEYIDNWSLGGDLKILFKTIPAVINGKGAA